MSNNSNTTKIDKRLLRYVRGKPDILYNAAAHLIKNGGKRLRPFMVVSSCQMFGGLASRAIPVACAVEMIHNFTLIHDDIMDRDDVRHGVPTVHKKYGNDIAILAGDVLFSKAFHTAATSSSGTLSSDRLLQIVSRLSEACVDVCEGQVLDIRMAADKKTSKRTRFAYMEMIGKKTAALFDVSCAMGTICADRTTNKDIKNMSSFGRNLGLAFQITDDLIGVAGDPTVTKKPVGNDIREGKKSLPILMALDKADRAQRGIISRCFGNTKAKDADLRKAVGTIKSLGIEESVRRQAMAYARKAQKSLDVYDGDSRISIDAKNKLSSLLDFVVKRSV